MKRGFWGDVASSPFAAVGIECDEAATPNSNPNPNSGARPNPDPNPYP
jgi:hypothetical protein